MLSIEVFPTVVAGLNLPDDIVLSGGKALRVPGSVVGLVSGLSGAGGVSCVGERLRRVHRPPTTAG